MSSLTFHRFFRRSVIIRKMHQCPTSSGAEPHAKGGYLLYKRIALFGCKLNKQWYFLWNPCGFFIRSSGNRGVISDELPAVQIKIMCRRAGAFPQVSVFTDSHQTVSLGRWAEEPVSQSQDKPAARWIWKSGGVRERWIAQAGTWRRNSLLVLIKIQVLEVWLWTGHEQRTELLWVGKRN